ncbi:MAG: putative RNase [Friedmanniella sp.]|nr:putative RNase [Friedmanniella sp.]
MSDTDDLEQVVRLEQALLDPGVRSQPAVVEALLHPDYREFGASGRVWDRDAIVAALAQDPGVSGEAVGFTPVRLGDDVVLLTYEVLGEAGSLRSSVWVRGAGPGWRVRFHQGTRTPR